MANAEYWDSRAEDIDRNYGVLKHDFADIKLLIEELKVKTLLDFGCGSGRLFPNYNNVIFLGLDISEKAVSIAKSRYPERLVRQGDYKSISGYWEDCFDLTICCRVLSGVEPKDINDCVKELCRVSKYIYVDEMTESEYRGASHYWYLHDLELIFFENGFVPVKTTSRGIKVYGSRNLRTSDLEK